MGIGERVGTCAALLQGMVGSPLGLLLMRVVADGMRPADPVIVLTALGRNSLAVAALAVTLAVHFVPYSWLYATPNYIVVGFLIAVGTRTSGAKETRQGSAITPVCILTGICLLLGGGVALII